MNYSQLIQFKRLEERAFVFLNGKQMMFGFIGMFAGMSAGDKVGLSGWPSWVAAGLFAVVGIVLGGIRCPNSVVPGVIDHKITIVLHVGPIRVIVV